MGKNWRGGNGSGGGGGGGGADLTSVRGYGCVIGTCDMAREREANKELVNLLNQTLDDLYPLEQAPKDESNLSVQDALAAELNAVRSQSHASTQRVLTLKSGIKGFVIARISDRSVCPVKVVAEIFERVKKTGLPCARHLVRLIPLQKTFYPNQEELLSNISSLIEEKFEHVPTDIQGSESTNNKRTISEVNDSPEDSKVSEIKDIPFKYNIYFNRRNNDVITRQAVIDAIIPATPKNMRYNYKSFEVSIVFECLCFALLARFQLLEYVTTYSRYS